MDMHAMRVLSLANGVAGVLNSAVLSVHGIGQVYARLARITPKAGVKQFDRTLSNEKPARPARKGINPFTKQEQTFAAKPASKAIRARAAKAAKDAVG